jgi:hypothetical protein
MILNVTFNVTSDLMIFLIPLPLFFNSSLPWKRKILLMLPFTMGVFTIFAAIICKVESLLLLSSEWWGLWCMREVSMAVIVANVPYSWGLLRRWTNAGSFLASAPDKSPAYSPQSSQTESKHRLLSAARSSLSFGSSRKQSVASRSTSGHSFSEDAFVKNYQYDDRRHSTAILYPPNAARFHLPSPARQSISAAAVDKLYKLDPLDENLDEKSPATLAGAGHGSSDRSLSWVPGTAAIDKLYDLNEYHDEKDRGGCLGDDASASAMSNHPLSCETTCEGLEARQFFGSFEFDRPVRSSPGDAV